LSGTSETIGETDAGQGSRSAATVKIPGTNGNISDSYTMKQYREMQQSITAVTCSEVPLVSTRLVDVVF
jgi:hypothetical protein